MAMRIASGAQDGRITARGVTSRAGTETCVPLAREASASISGEVAAGLPSPKQSRCPTKACPYPSTRGGPCTVCQRIVDYSRLFERRDGFDNPTEKERQKLLNRVNMREYTRIKRLTKTKGNVLK